ncbi:hypothetical protein JK358_26270 [Nocardia sp. 2]|uniref:Uncharacterized protein n=1 Tax=Nocardia acididurans TaxID=2802282 RepID=A0ABS1MCA2_9NOCA|nr:hypothetical protein [Nocardia acididurans]MBL1077916.1 hypothetical protein [Nocardia acididurans]
MTYITTRRGPSALTSALLGSCRRGVDRLWARRNLTPEERANLMACYTPPAIVSASLGVHTHR